MSDVVAPPVTLAAQLNEACQCIWVDRDKLRSQLVAQLGADAGVLETRPGLVSGHVVFVGSPDAGAMDRAIRLVTRALPMGSGLGLLVGFVLGAGGTGVSVVEMGTFFLPIALAHGAWLTARHAGDVGLARAVVYFCVFPMWFLASCSLGGAAGTIVNIVPANTRATATAAFFLFATMVGLALGPYTAGKISGAFGGNLRIGLAGILVVVPFAMAALEICRRDLIKRERA